MTTGFQKIAPLLCCGVACVALVAAGFVLFDSRDDLNTTDDVGEAEFVSYVAEADEVAEEPASDEGADAEREREDVDFQELSDDGEWEILEPRAADDGEAAEEEADVDEERATGDDVDIVDNVAVGGTGQAHGQTGRLIVITNFTRARVTVNGDAYPAYSDDGENRGMELPARQTHEVFVEFEDSERVYDVELEPGEERLLMVELTGMNGSEARTERRSRPDQRRRSRPQDRDDDDDIADDEGRITVYSRPRGDIFVGGRETGEQTPSTVDVDPGRHEVQVRYPTAEMSETKTVRVREGSRVKLFFRDDDDDE